jgi:RNase adaptor protein for sRNA GlmZ degradation
MLNVRIFSFSYKKSGIPKDTTLNGGGFVFDCRFIYNPGREEKYKSLTGKDAAVIEFLDKNKEMRVFLDDVFDIIDKAVDNYSARNFTDLMVCFGCTGGQHRSVYASEKLREHLDARYGQNIKLTLIHKEFPGL